MIVKIKVRLSTRIFYFKSHFNGLL